MEGEKNPGRSLEELRHETVRAEMMHVESIVDIVQDIFPQDFDFGEGFDAKKCRDLIERAIQDPNEFISIHIENEKVIGFTYYINKPPTNGVVILEMTGVRKEMQGRGVGKDFLPKSDELAVKYFREERGVKNLATIMLTTSADNPVAQKLYRSCGYEPVGTVPGMVGTGNTELIMLKRVSETAYRQGLWTKPEEKDKE